MGFPGEYRYQSDLHNMSASDISSWMLSGMNILPAGHPGDESPAILLDELYKKETPEQQKKLASALTHALEQWSSRTYTTDTLRSLISSASPFFTNNETALPAIIAIVDERRIPPSDQSQAEAAAVSVTSAFTTNIYAHEALKRWWSDESMKWEYTQLLFNGLVHSEPQNVRALLPKLLRVMEEHPDHFVPGLIAEDTAEVVGVDKLEMVLKELSGPAAQKLLAEIPLIKTLN